MRVATRACFVWVDPKAPKVLGFISVFFLEGVLRNLLSPMRALNDIKVLGGSDKPAANCEREWLTVALAHWLAVRLAVALSHWLANWLAEILTC